MCGQQGHLREAGKVHFALKALVAPLDLRSIAAAVRHKVRFRAVAPGFLVKGVIGRIEQCAVGLAACCVHLIEESSQRLDFVCVIQILAVTIIRINIHVNMAGCHLILRSVKIGVVRQTVIGPGAGGLVVFVGRADGRIDKDPASVYKGFCPPVITYVNIVFGEPVVGRHRKTVSVDETCRDALCARQCQINRRESLAGRVNLAGNAVCTAQTVFKIVEIVVRVGVLIGVRRKRNGVVVKVRRGIFVNSAEFFVIACRPCRNAVGNCLEIGRLVLCDRVVHIGCGIAQDEADVLQTVVQVFVKTVGLPDFLNGAIVVDDVLIAQNLDLAICHLDLHIFVQNPGGSIALQRRVLSACVSADVEVVIPFGML